MTIFQEFRNHNFDSDSQYQNFILKSDANDSSVVNDSLETRHSYWNKNFQPFDLDEYKEWLSRLDSAELDSKIDILNINEKTFSFQEIMDLVQKGEPVPGIRIIPDIVHSKQEASKSSLEPIKKPWEK